jgi:hypothetical protein
MGKNNRQRRASKKRQQARWSGPRTGPTTATEPAGRDVRDLLESLAYAAASAAEYGDEEHFDSDVATLARYADPGGPFAATVDMVMSGCLLRAVRAAWENGWQPADIVRAARKRLGSIPAGIAGAVIGSEARTSAGPGVAVPEPWAEQLRLVATSAARPPRWSNWEQLGAGVELLGLLTHLPAQPCLLPPPSQWGRGRSPSVNRPRPSDTVDSRILAKVRALLAKAESTNFEAEADALTAKAQELMARHAIDQAMVADRDGTRGDAPSGRRIGIDDPYPLGKANLLSAVARANRCRTVWEDKYGFSTLFGFATDMDIVEVLYTSLLVQATRAMTAAGSVRDGFGRSRTRSFRQSFLISFASRIGERLREVTTAATEQAEAVHGEALLPVLAGRRTEVDDAFATVFPDLTRKGVRISNYDGWVAGRIAADQAHLGPEHQALPDIAV